MSFGNIAILLDAARATPGPGVARDPAVPGRRGLRHWRYTMITIEDVLMQVLLSIVDSITDRDRSIWGYGPVTIVHCIVW